MNRQVLLIEPNYKNKYPPMGLMKLATYYRLCGDNVRFFKGNLLDLAADLICDDLIKYLEVYSKDIYWKKYYPILFGFVRTGKNSILENEEIFENEDVIAILKEYRNKFKNKDYFLHPRFDKVGITTLFTFYWDITIDTINFAKQLCKNQDDVMVGGILATLHPNDIFEATGINPFRGLLSCRGAIDEGNSLIIDRLPLDYSILEEIDYVYPAHNAYFAYMTRGCVNHCSFCAVPKLEPKYNEYIALKKQIDKAKERFGEQRDLLLLDNNVLASEKFNKIVDEIKECGFGKGANFVPPNEYDITIKNLQDSYNDRAYIRKAVKLYKETLDSLKDDNEKKDLYMRLEDAHCLYDYTATADAILELDEYFKPFYEKTHKFHPKKRIIDFNQGIDSRLINSSNMKKLAELNIYPLRIAFDHWNLRTIYEKSVRTAAKAGIKNLSNYLLYNYEDKPEELYQRLKLNVDLCDELGISIYSFPMKYHPIDDPEYFKNRDYIGEHWNRKFIRAVQAVLNSTKGKIGKGVDFFEEAFGRDEEEFNKILWMPETFIIYRRQYDANLRKRLAKKYPSHSKNDCNKANEWWKKFNALSPEKRKIAEDIIKDNKFQKECYNCNDKEILKILSYYEIPRN